VTADPISAQGPTAPGEDGAWRTESDSRRLLRRLREAMAESAPGQARLDRIVRLVAESMRTEVCSIYLSRDPETMELCATTGLNPDAVHKTRMRVGEGLVGRVAREGVPVAAADAPSEPGFRYMPETGEERFTSFLGVPIQRLGEGLGVLVVQSREARDYTSDEVYALEIVAMVLAEMAELGALTGGEMGRPHRHPALFRGVVGQEGTAGGHVWLHEPRVVVTNPIAEDPVRERERLHAALEELRGAVDALLDGLRGGGTQDQREVFEAYRMFAASRGWPRRMEEAIAGGLSAEAAVEKEQSVARARMMRADPYLRERLQDLDDLSNRLLRILTGQGRATGAEMPEDPVLVARDIGPGDLLEYGRGLKAIVLEEGSVGSHAAIVARAWAVPLLIQARGIHTEALNGDRILVDGEQGVVHLRPPESVENSFRDKMAMRAEAQARYASLRELPAQARCGSVVGLQMNAGLIADLPSLPSSGAEGVGLFRTELQFLARSSVPRRGELAALYARVMDAASGKRVVFRTLDIGSDKVLPFMKREDEPNPAMGWRAIRVGLDKRGVMRMQLQALIRAAGGRPLTVMFPFVAQMEEFCEARQHLLDEIERERRLGRVLPSHVEIGAMLETPSLAFAPRRFYETADFVSIGGNDLKQFFFAADRENERVRRRYDTLNVSYLSFLGQIVERCAETGTPLSFCGEDAGRPIEAVAFAAMGLRTLSMRPASIGPVKSMLRRVNLEEARAVIERARAEGHQSVRPALRDWLRSVDWAV
jgi:phosphotransferase system enzyme I (PtsP)